MQREEALAELKSISEDIQIGLGKFKPLSPVKGVRAQSHLKLLFETTYPEDSAAALCCDAEASTPEEVGSLAMTYPADSPACWYLSGIYVCRLLMQQPTSLMAVRENIKEINEQFETLLHYLQRILESA